MRAAPVVPAGMLLLLLLPFALAAHPAASGPVGPHAETPTVVGCGETSPLDNACSPGLILVKHRPTITVSVLGFVGHLRVQLVFLEDDNRVFNRDFDAAGQGLALGGFTDSGSLNTGERALVNCSASGLQAVYANGARIALPAKAPVPAGPWRCDVDAS